MEEVKWNSQDYSGSAVVSANGLQVTTSASGTSYSGIRANQGKDSGKWYWEVKSISAGRYDTIGIGISLDGSSLNFGTGYTTGDYKVYRGNGSFWSPVVSSKPTFRNEVIGIALDLDNGQLSFYKDGVSVGVAYTGLSGKWFPLIRQYGAGVFLANFGKAEFEYSVPMGYKPYYLNTETRNFIMFNNNYYFYKDNSWQNIGSSPTKDVILNSTMEKVTASQITEFELNYGKIWNAVQWTDGDGALNATLNATPYSQILEAKNSIQLTGVESATFNWTATGSSRIALSVDDGLTYHAFKNGIWMDITSDISQGMTASEYTSMTWAQYELLKGESNFLKHKYYIPDNSTVDDILIKAQLMGTNRLSNTSDFDLSYNQSAKTININIKKSGSFFATYLDV